MILLIQQYHVLKNQLKYSIGLVNKKSMINQVKLSEKSVSKLCNAQTHIESLNAKLST